MGVGFEILFWMIVGILSCFCCAIMLYILYFAYCEWVRNREKERRKGMDVIYYLCDRKVCGEICPNPECNHTTRLEHAVNFEAVTDENGTVLYYEEKEKRWIPCSERLPEEYVLENGGVYPSDEVLVYLYFGENNVGNRCAVSRYWSVMESRYRKSPWIDLDNVVSSDNIVAWMPLPKSYK